MMLLLPLATFGVAVSFFTWLLVDEPTATEVMVYALLILILTLANLLTQLRARATCSR